MEPLHCTSIDLAADKLQRSYPKGVCVWGGGVLRFGLDKSVQLKPQNLYPLLGVILAEKVVIFRGFPPTKDPKIERLNIESWNFHILARI